MTLKSVYDTIDDVPEALREYYPEDNGKFVFAGVENWKPQAEFEKLNTALTAERKVSKQFKDAAAVWESKFTGKSPEEIIAQLERIPVLEAESQGKVDSKKLESIVETTAKQRMAPLEHEINKLKASIIEREQEISAFKAADRRRTIHDAVRSVASKEGFQPSSYASPEGSLMLIAERYLTINSVGDVVMGDDVKPYTPGLGIREALVEIRLQHPYLAIPSAGGGATGNNGTGNNGPNNNPFKSNNLQERGAFIKANTPDAVARAVKAAGLQNAWDKHPEGK